MILQSLANYYDRKRKLEPQSVPPLGFEKNAISFVVVIDPDGSFVNLEDWREGEGKRKHGKALFVPQSKDRPGIDSWKTAFLLWDHPRYVLGLPKEGDDKETPPKRLEVFRQRILESFPDPSVETGINAVVRFYEKPENFKRLQGNSLWPQIEQTNGNISFRLRDTSELVCQSPIVRDKVMQQFKGDTGLGVGQCLINGQHEAIAELHPATPVQGSQATAKIHSFNLPAFNSYGKEQGANAPVSKRAAFAYTTALNYLIGTRNRQSGKQCIRVGDASTVFWADKPNALEDNFSDIFDEPRKDDPDQNTRALESLYKAPQQGIAPIADRKTGFFVLGLSPNAARIVIRFWYIGTVADVARNILQHFEDLRLVHGERDKPNLTLRSLLNATAPATMKYPKGDPDKVPPNLGGETMRAILECLPYLATLLQGAVRRIRAEKEVSYPRAAVVKAYLNRARQMYEKELTMSLDENNTDVAYLLGRLFFVLEEAQWAAHSTKANPGTNTTIRDRFYGAASATPITVFPQLLRLYPHHISKAAKSGRKGITVRIEKLVDAITSKLPATNPFPSYMAISDQGRFAVGYYHQRHDFFSSNHSE